MLVISLNLFPSDNWQYIGIIASDNNYGGAGLSAFLTHASTINNNGSNEFCIAFQYKLENPQSVAIQVGSAGC